MPSLLLTLVVYGTLFLSVLANSFYQDANADGPVCTWIANDDCSPGTGTVMSTSAKAGDTGPALCQGNIAPNPTGGGLSQIEVPRYCMLMTNSACQTDVSLLKNRRGSTLQCL